MSDARVNPTDDPPPAEEICCRELHGVEVQPDTCCCNVAAHPRWVIGRVESLAGPVPRIATKLAARDRLGTMAMRLGIGRMRYSVSPGLYAIGQPTPDSPVLVTANYKLTLDALRKELAGVDAWIVVLDTKGINVWCAAGKGTFGTDELVERIAASGLVDAVSHRTVILPQLGAPGVAAHEVKQRSGFSVVYGPVRAADIPAFLAAANTATQEMRRVRFRFADRLAVVPVELVHWGVWAIVIAAAMFFLASMTKDGLSRHLMASAGLRSAGLLLLAFAGGAVVAPLMLPWLPGRALSAKGVVVGVALSAVATAVGWIPLAKGAALVTAAWWLLMPAVSAFMAMGYTGSTTYTSLSGVKREMRLAVPVQIIAAAVGVGLWIAARFVSNTAA